MSPCRSLLFVPASKPEIFPKALSAGADVVCVDLEDAVGPLDKDTARPAAIEFLQSSGGAQRAVRINSLRSRTGLQDILAAQDATASIGVIVLPKVESADEVVWGDELLRGVPGVRLGALIETARGLENCFEIASACPRLEFLIFGAVDLAADMSLALEDQALAYARGRLSHAAHRAGVGLLDVPCIQFRDLAEVERQTVLAKKLGFTGKAAIHSTNIAVINRGFTPSASELDEARDIVAAVAKADAVMNNLRGDQPGKLCITYDDLKGVNSRIVCGHLSGYGRTGPRAGWPAYDYLAQAEAGYLDLTGEPGSLPTRMGLSIIDYMSGVTAGYAVTAALLGAARSGQGCDIDVTLYDVAMHQLTYPATWYLNEGYVSERRPRSGHPSVVPSEMFPTGDGWLFVMCITPKFWEALCEGVGRPDLPADARFRGYKERLVNRDALAEILDKEFARATTAEWMERLAGTVPVAPVLTLQQAIDNPYFHATGGVLGLGHPTKNDFRMISSPIHVDGERVDGRPAAALGAGPDAILAESGIGPAEIQALRADGAI